MRRFLLLATLSLAAGTLSACGPKLIPGTEIVDTDDSREIIDVMGAYTKALESRDVDGILSLVSNTFFETSGTAEGEDDFDKAGLEEKLKTWAEQTKSVRATIQVKNVVVEGDKARAPYFFDLSYQVPDRDGKLVWKNESDLKEMTFRREDGKWRIVSGI